MKKILALTSVLALAACGSAEKEIAKHDADFAGCERIATSAEHLVYKCPSDMEMFAEVKKQEANAAFLTWGEDEALIKEAAQDAQFTLVEVVLGNANDCKDNFHYRTMVKPISEEMWAVTSCKPVVEQPAEQPAEAPVAE